MAKGTESVSRKMLQWEMTRLRQELEKLQEKVEAVSDRKRSERPEASAIVSEGKATEADFIQALNPTKQALADLALAIHHLTPKKSLPRPQKTRRKSITRSGQTYRIRLPDEVRNRTVTLRNRGSQLVVNPRIVVNGRRDWFNAATILEEILEPGMSDREKALAIWQLMRDHRFHDVPAHRSMELHDPTRFLNGYGYGWCNDAAANLAVLAEKAGLRSRVWSLKGHVVPEVYFEGGWHMLDPDGEIYYLEDDGVTIASVETLEKHPDLFYQCDAPGYLCPIERMIEIYTTTENNQVNPFYKKTSEARHTMAYVLRPGEELMRSWDNWRKYFSSFYLDEPIHYGNGRFTFVPVFADDLFRKGAETVRGLCVEPRGSSESLRPSQPTRMGYLVYRFVSPYPFLDGNVCIAGGIQERGCLELAFSETGADWQSVRKMDRAGEVKADIPLGGYFRLGYDEPMYTYFLKISLSRGGWIGRLQFTSDIQVAPRSLPAPEKGENQVRYVDETKGNRKVEIIFTYDTAAALAKEK